MLFNPILLLRFLSEIAGTAMLMCVGCMGIFHSCNSVLQSSLHFGLVIMVIHCFGCMSVAHTNPIITFACLALGNVKFLTAMVHDNQYCVSIPNIDLTALQLFGIELKCKLTRMLLGSSIADRFDFNEFDFVLFEIFFI